MQKLQNTVYWAILASEASHIFCCVLPTIFSILSLLAGLGLVTVIPGWLEDLHAVLHNWEVPMIIASGMVVALGWALYAYSRKIDCHDTGCKHGACEPRKITTSTILKIATVLFIVNVSVYSIFHHGMEAAAPVEQGSHASHAHHGHAH